MQRVRDRVAERHAGIEREQDPRGAARSKRLRSTPARNDSGTSANEIRKSTQTTEFVLLET